MKTICDPSIVRNIIIVMLQEVIMFGIGIPELLLILVIALVCFGPKKLPEIGQACGKGLREFKDAVTGVKSASAAVPAKADSAVKSDASEAKTDAAETAAQKQA